MHTYEILVLIASIFFTLNKIFLLFTSIKVNQRIKWSMGVIAALLFIVYFYVTDSFILATVEIGLTLLMLYRTVYIHRKKQIEFSLGIITLCIMIFQLYLLSLGMLGIIQFLASLGMLVGTYIMTQDKFKVGFVIYGIGHIFACIYGYSKGLYIFSVFQLLQACICMLVLIPYIYSKQKYFINKKLKV